MKFLRLSLEFFSSVRLAIFTLAALIAICLIGALVPQSRDLMPLQLKQWQAENSFFSALLQPLGLFSAFDSWVFFFSLALFLGNLFVCTLKTCFTRKSVLRLPFSARGVRLWGVVICHFGLLSLAASIFIDHGFGSQGMFLVRENTWFQGSSALYRGHSYHYGRFSRPDKPGPPTTDFSLFFEKLTVDYKKEISTKRSFQLYIAKDGKSISASIAPNKPLHYHGYSFTMNEYGIAPRLALWNERGELIACDFVYLDPLERTNIDHQQNELVLMDVKDPQGKPKLKVKIDFYPNAIKIDPKTLAVENDGYAIKNPVFVFTLQSEGKIIGRQLLRYENQANPSYCHIKKYTIGVDRINYWCTFRMSQNPALSFVYLSMWICLLGVVLCYMNIIFNDEVS